MELPKHELEQDFVNAWNRDQRRLRAFVVERGGRTSSVDDFLQDTAESL